MAAVAGVAVGVILVIVDGVALGLAVAMGGKHPRGPAWAVVVAGLGSILVGLVQAYQGESVAFTRVATIIFPTVITLWVAWMSLRMLRTTGAATSAA